MLVAVFFNGDLAEMAKISPKFYLPPIYMWTQL
jgi:hypothetical protein